MNERTYTWSEARQTQPGLPSHRKVDYWARLGALGPGMEPGTGNDRAWTRRQLSQLAAIQTLADDLDGFGLPLSMPLIKRVWDALGATDWTVLNSGNVRIIAQVVV